MRDADGHFWFVGRADDVIKSAGPLIAPFEVGSVLMEAPRRHRGRGPRQARPGRRRARQGLHQSQARLVAGEPLADEAMGPSGRFDSGICRPLSVRSLGSRTLPKVMGLSGYYAAGLGLEGQLCAKQGDVVAVSGCFAPVSASNPRLSEQSLPPRGTRSPIRPTFVTDANRLPGHVVPVSGVLPNPAIVRLKAGAGAPVMRPRHGAEP